MRTAKLTHLHFITTTGRLAQEVVPPPLAPNWRTMKRALTTGNSRSRYAVSSYTSNWSQPAGMWLGGGGGGLLYFFLTQTVNQNFI